MSGWLRLLKQQVEAKGVRRVAQELSLSKSTVSLVVTGRYPASTRKIEEAVRRVYGEGKEVRCPVLGQVPVEACVRYWEEAQRVGLRTNDPEKLRLFFVCRGCPLREGRDGKGEDLS